MAVIINDLATRMDESMVGNCRKYSGVGDVCMLRGAGG